LPGKKVNKLDLSSYPLVFMGTPGFAIPCLKALIDAKMSVEAVVTQPDRPAGRGKKMTPPPVKVFAKECGLPVFQPETLNDPDFFSSMERIKPAVIIVVAYGRLMSGVFLRIPKIGTINIHASLLPLYRGAAPINWAVIHGRKETGVTLMQIDKGLDAGPLYAFEKTPILPEDNALTLNERLSGLGAGLLMQQLPFILKGEITPVPQDDLIATYAPMLKKEMGLISWQRPALEIHNLVRGLYPWPGAYTFLNGKRIKIKKTLVVSNLSACNAQADNGQGMPGEIIALQDGIDVLTGSGILRIIELQVEGARPLDYKTFLSGRQIKISEILSK